MDDAAPVERLMDDVTALASLLKQPSDSMRFERGTVVADTPPTPAHSRVQLADGRIISVLGRAAVDADVTVIVGGGVAIYAPAPRFGVIATRTAANVANSTITALTWSTIVQDTHSYLPTGSSTVTIKNSGVYSIAVTLNSNRGITTRGYVELATVGSLTRTLRTSIMAGEDKSSLSTTLALGVGDTVKVSMYQVSGGTASVSGTLDLWRISV
jgi:hypothetical protein